MPSPIAVAEECRSCRGWGFVLGTDTPDKWGKVCNCGCDIHVPISALEKAQLQSLHDAARRVGVRSSRLKAAFLFLLMPMFFIGCGKMSEKLMSGPLDKTIAPLQEAAVPTRSDQIPPKEKKEEPPTITDILRDVFQQLKDAQDQANRENKKA